MITAELIAIGNELLLGNIVDTNSAHLARALHDLGLDVRCVSIVGDEEEDIAIAVARALERADLVITTGGLGPTVDDKTRAGVARATGREMVFQPELLAQIEARFARWGRRMSANNRRQAYIPQGGLPIENPVGTAPIFVVEEGARSVICLPGVPREMTYLLQAEVIPYLRRRFTLNSVLITRVLYTSGLGESMVDSKIGDLENLGNPVVGLAAHAGVVDIRITARADSPHAAQALIASVEQKARQRLGNAVFGADGDSLEQTALARLAAEGKTVAVRESGTRGWLAGKLAEADAGQGVFLGGELLATLPWGADLESEAADLAQACLERYASDLGLAVLIVARDGQIEVGLAVADGHSRRLRALQRGFGGHPEYAREWSANACLNLLRIWDPARGELF